jgi:hypothetical protein
MGHLHQVRTGTPDQKGDQNAASVILSRHRRCHHYWHCRKRRRGRGRIRIRFNHEKPWQDLHGLERIARSRHRQISQSGQPAPDEGAIHRGLRSENPVRTARATELRGATGFALNGVLIRPGTADYYDPSSPRGFSRDPASGWKLDGKGAGSLLGLDQNNAHVDHRGLYHYHANPTGLLKGRTSTLVGFAADGFEIHYVGSRARSGYTLKPGNRQGGPGGRHDGTYVRDWQFTGGTGTLDQCNGGKLDGRFVYFVTDSYPYFPIAPGARSVAISPGPESDRGCRVLHMLHATALPTRVSGQHLPAIDRHQGSGLSN